MIHRTSLSCPAAAASPLRPSQPFLCRRPPRAWLWLKGLRSLSSGHSAALSSQRPAWRPEQLPAPEPGSALWAPPGRAGAHCWSRARATPRAAFGELCRPRSSFPAKLCFLQGTGGRTQQLETGEGLCRASPQPPVSGAPRGS